MRILAVDDDPVVLELLRVVFRDTGLPEIATADSAEEALALLDDDQTDYDCLLLDIRMDTTDGTDLCRRIRTQHRYRNTPIVMLTAVTDQVEIERAFAAGANDYVTKPFEVKDIVTRIRVARRMAETIADAPLLDLTDTGVETPPGRHGFKIDAPVRLKQCDRLVLPFSLGNYLSQLSRGRLANCTVFALQIERIAALYDRCSTRQYALVLSNVVEAILDVIDDPNTLMAYAGNGVFLCILQGENAPPWPAIEGEIQRLLRLVPALGAQSARQRIELSVGNPVPPKASRNQRVKMTFERAIERAQMRARSKTGQPDHRDPFAAGRLRLPRGAPFS